MTETGDDFGLTSLNPGFDLLTDIGARRVIHNRKNVVLLLNLMC